MAEAGQKPEKANVVPYQGDHDRVAMLSLNADGTANQHNPEVVIEKDAFVEASSRQFAEQAVSSVDVEKRGVSTVDTAIVGTEEGKPDELVDPSKLPQDPGIEELQKAHDEAAKKGAQSAEQIAGNLIKSQG
jgi:hypothetical protein